MFQNIKVNTTCNTNPYMKLKCSACTMSSMLSEVIFLWCSPSWKYYCGDFWQKTESNVSISIFDTNFLLWTSALSMYNVFIYTQRFQRLYLSNLKILLRRWLGKDWVDMLGGCKSYTALPQHPHHPPTHLNPCLPHRPTHIPPQTTYLDRPHHPPFHHLGKPSYTKSDVFLHIV